MLWTPLLYPGPKASRLQGWGFLEGLLQGYNDSSQTEGIATSLVLRPGLDLENVELMSSLERGQLLGLLMLFSEKVPIGQGAQEAVPGNFWLPS